MATRGSSSSRATATGLALAMIAASTGVSSAAGFTLLLSFAGVLAGTILVFVGVGIADNPAAAWVLAAGARVRALVHRLRRNLALVGLLLASAAASAVAAADREAAPVLCFSAFALLLLGLSLLNVGVRLLGEQEQEH